MQSSNSLLLAVPTEIRSVLSDYFDSNGMPMDQLVPVDIVLGLLRIGTPEARDTAQRISGVDIQVLPAVKPPWPPKPVSRGPTDVLVRKTEGAYPKHSRVFARYSLLRVGMTRDKILAKGITTRDLSDWKRMGFIEMETRR